MVRLLLLLFAWLCVATPALARPNPVILVSIDGFRFDYLGRGRTPALAALAAQGVVAPMRPSFPSVTFPNHYTLVTGRVPDRHGIVDNVMDDPAIGHFTMAQSVDPRWWDAAEPLWVTARRQGLNTAVMFWPGSEHPIRGLQPDQWRPYDKGFLAEQRVDQVLAWLDAPQERRPDFVALYFDLVDTVGHRSGPDSPELDAALASTDAAIGRLVEGLKARGLFARTNLVVVADHGMAGVSPQRVVYLDDLVPAAALRLTAAGPMATLSLAPSAPRGSLGRLLALRGHARCWRKGELPRAFRYGRNPRVPPIVCLAETGWSITTHARAAAQKEPSKGAHGFDPAAPEMAALFVAEGPAFRPGATLPTFDNVDVHPLLARLLGLAAPRGDGTAGTFDRVLSAH